MTGTVTISIEVELGWGYHDLSDESRYRAISPGRVLETRTLNRLLKSCDDLEIPITFNIVGHLLLDSCEGSHDGPHRDGWFDEDPGTDVNRDPYFYAPDLVEAIEAADVSHEIATHTFSHVLCDEVSDETLAWELERAGDVHEWASLDRPVSLVPPRHQQPSPTVLANNKIRVWRSHTPTPVSLYIYRWLSQRWHPTREPANRGDVLVSPCTHSLSSPVLANGQLKPSATIRCMPTKVRQRAHEWYLTRGLAAAAHRDDYVHFWTHLWSIANEQQWKPIDAFLRRLASRRSDGDLLVKRMNDLP